MAKIETRAILKMFVIVLAFVVLVTYSLFRAQNLISGPSIAIIEPENGLDPSVPEVMLKGTAKNISYITLNGLQIYTDENGNFGRRILLSEGYNIITVAARDKFDRKAETRLELTYHSPASDEPERETSSTTVFFN